MSCILPASVFISKVLFHVVTAWLLPERKYIQADALVFYVCDRACRKVFSFTTTQENLIYKMVFLYRSRFSIYSKPLLISSNWGEKSHRLSNNPD